MIKVLFMGTPYFSTKILESLINSQEIEVVGVVTKKDSEQGRKRILTESPVALLAKENNLKVFKIEKFKDEVENLKALNADLIVTAAYGKILPESILSIPKYASINVHASLLPKYRGASPIEASIKNGDKETGITIMYMDKGMDTGNIIKEEKVIIEETDNLTSLTKKLAELGSNMIVDNIKEIVNNKNESIKQNDEEATYTHVITREDEHLDFNNNAEVVFNKVRSLADEPGAYVKLNNEIVKIYEGYVLKEESNKKVGTIIKLLKDGIAVKTKDYLYVITKLKPQGKKVMDAKSYINGLKEDIVGDIYE